MGRKLATGKLRAGDALPKISEIAERIQASYTTVVAELRRAEEQGYVHKKGRAWILGQRQEESNLYTSGPPSKPTILMLQHNLGTWRSMAFEPRYSSFFHAFERESNRFGIPSKAVFTGYGDHSFLGLPVGLDAILQEAKNLGNLYQGVVIPFRLQRIPGFLKWCKSLADLGKPVVWFDRNGVRPSQLTHIEGFYRVFHDETKGLHVALKALKESGHQKVLYVGNQNLWSPQRGELLAVEAEKLGLQLKSIVLGKEKVREGRFEKQFKKRVMQRKETALVVANDFETNQLLPWLLEQGLKVPQDLSIVSFDNYSRIFAHPFSTVDFGLDYLGYASFHLLSKFVPVNKAKQGEVISEPFVVDKGTIGPPSA